jgi:hypothetical protein
LHHARKSQWRVQESREAVAACEQVAQRERNAQHPLAHWLLGMAAIAADAHEPMLEAAALEVIPELTLDTSRRLRARRRQVRLERRVVVLNELI